MRYTKINEVELRRLYAEGKSDFEIADILGEQINGKISHSGVSRARQRLNLPPLFPCHCNTKEQQAMNPREKYEVMLEYSKNYVRDPEHSREIHKAWYGKNKERIKKIRALWMEARQILKTTSSPEGQRKHFLKRFWDASKHILNACIPPLVKSLLSGIKEKISKLRIWKFQRKE